MERLLENTSKENLFVALVGVMIWMFVVVLILGLAANNACAERHVVKAGQSITINVRSVDAGRYDRYDRYDRHRDRDNFSIGFGVSDGYSGFSMGYSREPRYRSQYYSDYYPSYYGGHYSPRVVYVEPSYRYEQYYAPRSVYYGGYYGQYDYGYRNYGYHRDYGYSRSCW